MAKILGKQLKRDRKEKEPENPIEVAKPSDDKTKLIEECGKITTEFGGESNVPVGHAYWEIKNKIRGMK